MPGNMNINRLLSRRDKDGSTHRRDKSRDKIDKSSDQKTRQISGNGVTPLFKSDKPDPQKSTDKDPEAKIIAIKKRLKAEGYVDVEDTQINYALASMHANGDVDKAFDMIVLFQESVEGIVRPYDPSIKMLGAQNRENVTCYLDALLFAMFARLSSFEPILFKTFDEEPLRRLSTLIRLWVNMLRTGKFIQTDITQHLQEALADCGWEEAKHLEQQDTSEAFSFITGKLDLPLLTLKMDIYHTGAEDANDDHKFIQERLLEVAVPDEPTDRDRPIRLEDCLEDYFNNRVEVVRHLDQLERTNTHNLERSDTVSSVRSALSISTEKASSQHVEISEVSWSPTAETPSSAYAPSSPLTPGGSGRHRAQSIIRTRVVEIKGEEEKSHHDSDAVSTRSSRKGTVLRKEVLMPAWQIFSLIPFVSGVLSKSEAPIPAGVAAQFSQNRPVLGICLKRYAMTEKGEPVKKKTFIDIPLDIRLPHFIQDSVIPEDGPMMGSFKLSLQSVICHRGDSVQKGHYISFIRGTSPIADGDSHSTRRLSNANRPPHYAEERWIKFDDLDTEHDRVSYVDIEEAMKKEDPYLLFYQVQPAYDVSPPPFEHHPPSYSDSAIPMQVVTNASPVAEREPQHSLPNGYFDGARDTTPTIRLSGELERPPTPPRRSINLPEDRRGSLAFTETSLASTTSSLQAMSAPVTPNEETAAQRISRAAARFTKSGSKSRPSSASGENRISATFSRLNLMRSKDSLNKVDMSKETISTNQSMTSTDGPSEPRTSITIEEASLKPEEVGIDRSKSKRGRKRGKSKEPSEKEDHEHNGHQHHHHRNKSKGKLLKDDSERECSVM